MSRPSPPPTPSKPHQPDSSLTPDSGLVLFVATADLICWFLTLIMGYTSPSAPISDDMIVLYTLLWTLQAGACVLLGVTAVSRGWSTTGAISSAALFGAGGVFVYGLCWAEWGNVAVKVFWGTVGIHCAVGVEMKFGFAEGLEKKIDVLLRS
jgi:hypothetical protein